MIESITNNLDNVNYQLNISSSKDDSFEMSTNHFTARLVKRTRIRICLSKDRYCKIF